MFKGLLGKAKEQEDTPYIEDLKAHFVPQPGFVASYSFMIEGVKDSLLLKVKETRLEATYGSAKGEDADVVAKISTDVMNAIMEGRMTFQRAFMTGEMTAKGNFKTLRMLDQVFHFGE